VFDDCPPESESKADNGNAQNFDSLIVRALLCEWLKSTDCSDKSLFVEHASARQEKTHNMMGNQVAECRQLKDENGMTSFFFIFPDLSFRWSGKYILRFDLFDIDELL
jgi:Velvet factor